MAQANLTIRLNDNDKTVFAEICEQIGLSVSAAMNVFVKAVIKERKIPFELSAKSDPFYSESNLNALRIADEQIKNGQTITKTFEELEEMAK